MEAILDLGALTGPVLVFGGPYGNLEATRAVLAEGRALGIPARRTICTGDLAAYCGDPAATVALLREAGIVTIMGNVEESLGAGAEDCACGYDEGSACDALAAQWYAFASGEIDGDARRWMAELPRALRFRLGARRLLVTHAAPSSINRFLFPSAADEVLAVEMAAADCDGVIAGHSGIPFSRLIGDRLWFNAGVVGMPANDGTPRGWYGVLRTIAGGISVEIRALDYDYRAAATATRRGDLPRGYADAIESGLWPSLDVLPHAERARTGAALFPHTAVWPDAADDGPARARA